MKLFVNLKRFDVPRSLGGVSEAEDPESWSEQIFAGTEQAGIYDLDDLSVVFLLPEAALPAARLRIAKLHGRHRASVEIGSQSVYREDISPGGNFGAFTGNRPAAAALSLGCTWTMIGHSEERRDKEGIVAAYDPLVETDAGRRRTAREAVDRLIGAEAGRAAGRGLRLLLCIGESADERADAPPGMLSEGVTARLAAQIADGLPAKGTASRPAGLSGTQEAVIAYEPVWAIGPGKTPPPPEYIEAVARFIRGRVAEHFGFTPSVVYGGGLKKENARAIGSIPSIDGGLVALTRFSGEIGFYPEELAEIVSEFRAGEASRRGGRR